MLPYACGIEWVGAVPFDIDRAVCELLVAACLFTGVGGYLDAYSYLAHGVFANAQTGNVVFLAVFVSGGQWAQAGQHLPPILAFALGVAIVRLLDVLFDNNSFRVALICQVFEFAILAILAVVGNRLPDASVVPIISFVAALQLTSFAKVGSWSFNSSIITGNLREAVSGLVLWIGGDNAEENRGKAITLGLICLSFFVGALFGGICSRFGYSYALVPCVVIVGVGFLLTWREYGSVVD